MILLKKYNVILIVKIAAFVQFKYTLIIHFKLLKLQQLKCMIRVYINYEVKLNDCGLCAGIISRSKFRKTT